MRAPSFLLLSLLVGNVPAVFAADSATRVQLATGLQYSSGSYADTERTNAWVMPFYARVSRSHWSLQMSAPWVSVRGPGSLTELLDDNGGLGSNSGSGGVSGSDDSSGSGSGGSGSGSGSGSGGGGSDDPPVDPGVTAPSSTISGLGDMSLTAGYSFDSFGGTPLYLDLRARVRLPTGSRSDGLGTGATDYAALAELGYAGSRGGVSLSGGRRLLGRVTGLDRVDGWQAGVGAWWNVSPHASVGANVDWRQASIRGGEDPRFAEVYASWYLSEVWKLEINGGVGLSDASADYAGGFTLTWRGRP